MAILFYFLLLPQLQQWEVYGHFAARHWTQRLVFLGASPVGDGSSRLLTGVPDACFIDNCNLT